MKFDTLSSRLLFSLLMTLAAPSTSGTVTEVQILETPLDPEILRQLMTHGAERVFFGMEQEQKIISPGGDKLVMEQRGEKIFEREDGIIGLDDIIDIAKKTGHGNIFSETVRILLMVGFEQNGFPSVRRRVSYVLERDSHAPMVLDFNTYITLMGQYGSIEKPTIPTFLNIRTTAGINEVQQFATSLRIDTKKMGQWTPEELLVQSHKTH